jgi:hypothetical protein
VRCHRDSGCSSESPGWEFYSLSSVRRRFTNLSVRQGHVLDLDLVDGDRSLADLQLEAQPIEVTVWVRLRSPDAQAAKRILLQVQGECPVDGLVAEAVAADNGKPRVGEASREFLVEDDEGVAAGDGVFRSVSTTLGWPSSTSPRAHRSRRRASRTSSSRRFVTIPSGLRTHETEPWRWYRAGFCHRSRSGLSSRPRNPS